MNLFHAVFSRFLEYKNIIYIFIYSVLSNEVQLFCKETISPTFPFLEFLQCGVYTFIYLLTQPSTTSLRQLQCLSFNPNEWKNDELLRNRWMLRKVAAFQQKMDWRRVSVFFSSLKNTSLSTLNSQHRKHEKKSNFYDCNCHKYMFLLSLSKMMTIKKILAFKK